MNNITKHTISSWILDELEDGSDLKELLSMRFDSCHQVEKARVYVRDEVGIISDDVTTSIREDLDEILEDLNWLLKPESKVILAVDRNYKSWEDSIEAEYPMNSLMIRAHIDKDSLAVVGKAKNPGDIDNIIASIEQISGFKVKLNKVV